MSRALAERRRLRSRQPEVRLNGAARRSNAVEGEQGVQAVAVAGDPGEADVAALLELFEQLQALGRHPLGDGGVEHQGVQIAEVGQAQHLLDVGRYGLGRARVDAGLQPPGHEHQPAAPRP